MNTYVTAAKAAREAAQGGLQTASGQKKNGARSVRAGRVAEGGRGQPLRCPEIGRPPGRCGHATSPGWRRAPACRAAVVRTCLWEPVNSRWRDGPIAVILATRATVPAGTHKVPESPGRGGRVLAWRDRLFPTPTAKLSHLYKQIRLLGFLPNAALQSPSLKTCLRSVQPRRSPARQGTSRCEPDRPQAPWYKN
jgi:hypothetical protein